MTKAKTISYSQFSMYLNCPRRWKLDYIDNLRTYDQNTNTIFGTAFHATIQHYLTIMYEDSVKAADQIDLEAHLKQGIYDEYKKALEKNGSNHFSTPQELSEYYTDGVEILKYIRRHRNLYFPSKQHKLLGIEKPLNLPLKGNVNFVGFIDLVILDERTNRVKIWDIKTSNSGWNKYQKADSTKTAQLILYKEFYAKQFNIDPESIDVEYFIVRRKINEDLDFKPKRVQTFSPASGKPTRNKTGKLLTEFIESCFTAEGEYNLERNYPALESSGCKYCPHKDNQVLCNKKERIKQK